MRKGAIISAFLLMVFSFAKAEDKPALVVFDIELQDGSHEGELYGVRQDQIERILLTSRELRRSLEETGKWNIVDLKPVQAEVDKIRSFVNCNGCDIDIARELGAEYAMISSVYKVSNLILEIHLFVRDVESGEVIGKFSSSIRGNNDGSWVRGVRWMVKNLLPKLELPDKS